MLLAHPKFRVGDHCIARPADSTAFLLATVISPGEAGMWSGDVGLSPSQVSHMYRIDKCNERISGHNLIKPKSKRSEDVISAWIYTMGCRELPGLQSFLEAPVQLVDQGRTVASLSVTRDGAGFKWTLKYDAGESRLFADSLNFASLRTLARRFRSNQN